MLLQYTAEVVRNWPGEGARERTELIKQGTVLVNGDVVTMSVDGTVEKVTTATKRAGLVVRGNGDSASASNANGTFMTPQPAKTITTLAWASGTLTATVTGHGYAVGNIVTIGGTITTANPVTIPGSYVIVTVPTADTFTVALAATPGIITNTSGTTTLTSTNSVGGSAIVLWGNYIVATSRFVAGSYVPGSPVTATSGMYSLANGTTDPEVGFVLRVQGASSTQTAHLVISAY